MKSCYNQHSPSSPAGKKCPLGVTEPEEGVAPKERKPMTIGKKRLKLGEHLVAMGLIDQATLDRALEEQKVRREKLGQILLSMGVADEESIAGALASQLNIPLVDLSREDISPAAVALVPAQIAAKHSAMPRRLCGSTRVSLLRMSNSGREVSEK